MNLSYFLTEKLYDAGRKFFEEELSIRLSQSAVTNLPAKSLLGDFLKGKDEYLLKEIEEAYLLGKVDENTFENKSEKPIDLEIESRKDTGTYKGILVFAIRAKSKLLSRSEIAKLTRALNRRAKDKPVIVLTRSANLLSYSTAERSAYKQEWREGEQVGKITMLKDINLQNVHAGHERILWDMKINPLLIDSFDRLYEHWKSVFSVQLLNETFYRELQNWYFWAQKHVDFPDDLEKDDEIRNSKNLIRLLTRIIFIWFIKEKGLIPSKLFSKSEIENILKDFYAKNGNETTYYRAILQNLFFGTLNQKMGDREFIPNEGWAKNRSNQGVKNYYRYGDHFKITEKDAIKLFEDVPFLNGGLFDCLDKDDENEKHKYVDGFSRNKKKQAKVPDFLFFDKEHDEDLNKFLGPNVKAQKVRGLINILNSYKFTVTENTPVEVEVALDPELLGKIFENLLASYNPETQTTARKQTGSFYTPREIVNYMVDESLITYLENALIGFYENPTLKQSSSTLDKNLFGEAKPKQAKLDITHSKINVEQKEEINKRLRHLLSYSEEEPFFNDEERLFLIHAIDDCNILDPACGSGAFPMGVLHKMVHILQKLDHDNEKWKELQRRKAIADTESAYKIGDNDEREKRLLEINDVFENNSSDYGRKLFLIENCIYGVDIQTIAVQIAKLRFFISLVIDQRKQDNADNFGIRSLPNLETKFVAANTLIALDIPAQLKIEDEELKELKTALREVRHEYFRAKNRNDKKRFQKNDKKIRDAIGENIKKELEEYEKSLVSKINIKEKELELSLKASPIKLPAKDAEKHKRSIEKLKREIEELKSGLLDSKSIDSLAYQISGWDPYDQNTSSGWFDAEWMFGVKKGFDIVIGNPPYIDIKGLPKDDVKLYFQIFKTTENRINLYSIFIEKGISLLNLNGILAYINPNSILINESYTKIRKHIVEGVERIIKLPDSVFVAATVETIILLSKRKSSNENILGVYFANNDKIDFTNLMFNSFSREEWRSDVDSRFNIFGDVKVTTLLKKINNNSSPLEKYVLSSLGITPYDKYKGHSEKLINNREFHSPTKISKHYVPLISGKNIHPFYISDEIDEYLKYGDWLGAPREKKFFENPKIIVRQIVGGNELKIIAGYSESPRYFTQIGFSLISKTDSTDTLKFILGLLNSSLINFYHRNKFLDTEKIVFQKILIANCKQLPIKEPIELKPFIKIVDKILTAKRNSKVTNTLEDEFDLMVYKLYNLTFEEVKIIEPKFAMSKEEYDNLSAIEAERVEASPIDNLQKKKRKGRGFDHEAIGKLFD